MTEEQIRIIKRYVTARTADIYDTYDWQKEVLQWKSAYLSQWLCSESEDPRQDELSEWDKRIEWAKRIEIKPSYGSKIYDGKKVAMSFFDESHTRANCPKEHNAMSFDDAMGFGGSDEN